MDDRLRPCGIEQIIDSASKALTEARRQAPAARMVGEFAVKQLRKEVDRLVDRVAARNPFAAPPER